ncbi:MAG: zeta toxin family protein [Prevotella sp.]|nr:zeta toxin family protein [Prevotella sp.]
MKTKTMKTIQLWMLALVLIISSSSALTSCSKDDTLVPPSPAQPVILTGEAAVAWTRDHLDSLVNVYMADCGNLLDPDMTRDLLSCIGYTRLNVFDYREAGWLIDSVVLVRLMDRAAERNNKTILFTMGMYGCGKTTCINNNPDLKKLVEEAGVVSEGAYNNVKYFDGVVEDMDKKGFVSSLIYVYNDAETGYTNCMERLISSNRAVTCEAYISVFPQFQGRVEYIEEHHPDMPSYCIDNNHNNGGKLVTNEEAKQWDYTMTEDLQQKIYAIKQSYIDSGKLTPEQIAALQ